MYDFTADSAFPAEMRVAAYRAAAMDGGRCDAAVFGIAGRDPKPVPAERRAPGELPPARVQVWHWKDLRQFHQQEVYVGSGSPAHDAGRVARRCAVGRAAVGRSI